MILKGLDLLVIIVLKYFAACGFLVSSNFFSTPNIHLKLSFVIISNDESRPHRRIKPWSSVSAIATMETLGLILHGTVDPNREVGLSKLVVHFQAAAVEV